MKGTKEMATSSQAAQVVAGVIVWLSCCAAQGQFAIEPLRTELEGEAGATLRGRFIVGHGKEEVMDLEIAFQDHSLGRTSFPEWIRFEAMRFPVDPDSQVAIPYVISVPPDASGELYGRVSFSEALPEGAGAVSIRTRLSLPVYVKILGTMEYAGAIRDVTVLSVAPLKIRILVSNAGNVHVRAQAHLRVMDAAGEKILFTEPIQKHAAVFYPGQDKELVHTSARALPPGRYRAVLTLPFPDAARALTSEFDVNVPDKSQEQTESEPEA
jgi:hypothetical protein